MILVHPAAPVASVLVTAVLVAVVLVGEVLVDPVAVKRTMRKVMQRLQSHKLFVLRRLLHVFFCQSRFASQFRTKVDSKEASK